MPIEFEAKFLNIDRALLRPKLQQHGFICITPDYLMRRAVFTLPNQSENSWARVRDEAGRITITFKQTVDATTVDGTEEIEIEANDFNKAIMLLQSFGLKQKSYQETRRELWHKELSDGTICEVTLDEWPALAPFCEIEATTSSHVQQVAAELGFSWTDAVFGPVSVVYERDLCIPQATINNAPLVTFDNVQEILQLAKMHEKSPN